MPTGAGGDAASAGPTRHPHQHASGQAAGAVPKVVIRAPWLFNRATRYAHSMPEVSGPEITVTRKTTVVQLGNQPPIIDNHERELFDRMPGIVLAEQQNPTELNVNYRGLGNPQESEYILLMQDGIPMEMDWIGYPTLYYIPVPETVSEVQMIRGGSGLLYGPEPEPVINFVSKQPSPTTTGTIQQVGGSDGLYSNFHSISGPAGPLELPGRLLASPVRRAARRTATTTSIRAISQLDYHIDGRQKLNLAVHAYSLQSGLAGLMSYTQLQADPNQTTTPDDRNWEQPLYRGPHVPEPDRRQESLRAEAMVGLPGPDHAVRPVCPDGERYGPGRHRRHGSRAALPLHGPRWQVPPSVRPRQCSDGGLYGLRVRQPVSRDAAAPIRSPIPTTQRDAHLQRRAPHALRGAVCREPVPVQAIPRGDLRPPRSRADRHPRDHGPASVSGERRIHEEHSAFRFRYRQRLRPRQRDLSQHLAGLPADALPRCREPVRQVLAHQRSRSHQISYLRGGRARLAADGPSTTTSAHSRSTYATASSPSSCRKPPRSTSIPATPAVADSRRRAPTICCSCGRRRRTAST